MGRLTEFFDYANGAGQETINTFSHISIPTRPNHSAQDYDRLIAEYNNNDYIKSKKLFKQLNNGKKTS